MADVFTPQKRSEVMSRILAKGNQSTEGRFIVALRRHGIKGWRRNSRLPGRPDFVFPERKVAVYLDGCFWHGCPMHFKHPVTNAEFWRLKIARNRSRDRQVAAAVRRAGWTVLRIWEHDLKTEELSRRTVRRLKRVLGRSHSVLT